MKIIAILLTFSSLAHANPQKIFKCQFKDSAQKFRIIENSPSQGLATIDSNNGQVTLTFTETTSEFSTRYGKDIVTTKIYFHYYYEFRLTVTKPVYYVSGNSDITMSGVRVAEMSPSKTFTCR